MLILMCSCAIMSKYKPWLPSSVVSQGSLKDNEKRHIRHIISTDWESPIFMGGGGGGGGLLLFCILSLPLDNGILNALVEMYAIFEML